MKDILDRINKKFEDWGAGIPENALLTKDGGLTRGGGWTLVYAFADDYIEVYQGHRHPGENCYRYYQDASQDREVKEEDMHPTIKMFLSLK